LRAALFDALVQRLDAKAHEDPSISVVNRMPTAFAVSRLGNLLTLSQGLGVRLLRGDLKWKDRGVTARTPDGIEGTPDEILDRIVAMFLERTAIGERSRPAVAERMHERHPTIPEAVQEQRATPRSQGERGTANAADYLAGDLRRRDD
jgi:hypothetical protein